MQNIEKIIRNEQDFLIIGHISPDGDTIGSGMALLLALQGLGKSAIFVIDGKVPEKMAFVRDYAPVYSVADCPKRMSRIRGVSARRSRCSRRQKERS